MSYTLWHRRIGYPFAFVCINHITYPFFIGACTLPLVQALPSSAFLLNLCLASIILVLLYPARGLFVISMALLGLNFVNFVAHKRQAYNLDPKLFDSILVIEGVVASLPITHANNLSFVLKTRKINGHSKVCQIQNNWFRPRLKLMPGDIIQLQVKLTPIKNYANPGSFDAEKLYFYQNIQARAYLNKGASVTLLKKSPTTSYCLAKMRGFLLRKLQQLPANKQVLGLITALSLGISKNIPIHTRELFQNMGIAHLLAISGLHLGILSLMLAKILKLFKVSPSNSAKSLIIFAGLFVLISGAAIATIRAFIMLTCFLMPNLILRPITKLQSFGIALWLVCIYEPMCFLATGFWLSFFCVACIFYLSSLKSRKVFLQFKLSALIAPITLFYFQSYAALSPLINLLFIPIYSIIVVPCALFICITCPFLPNVATGVLRLVSPVITSSLSLLQHDYVQSWPMLKFYLNHLQLISACIAMFILVNVNLRKYRLLGIFSLLPVFLPNTTQIAEGSAKVTVLDVGQGLSIVIQTKQHNILFDTGPRMFGLDAGKQIIANYMRVNHIKKFDYMIVSHADNDHSGGAKYLLENNLVQNIITNSTELFSEHTVKLCHADMQLILDEVQFNFLHPKMGVAWKKTNNASCVVKINAVNGQSMLLTADIERKAELQLLQLDPAMLKSDILLVAHHGSITSSSQEFLQAVSAKYAVISAGYKNKFKHPHPQISARLQANKLAVLNTPSAGAISFNLGGCELEPVSFNQQNRYFWRNLELLS